MLRWTLFFSIISILTAIFGLTDLADQTGSAVMIVFCISTGLFLISLVIREISLTKNYNTTKDNRTI